MRRDRLIGTLIGSLLVVCSFILGWLVEQQRIDESPVLMVAVHEPPPPLLVESWAPPAERKVADEIFAAHGEDRPASGRLMRRCKVRVFTFVGDPFDGRGRSQVPVRDLTDGQLNCLMAGTSKYVRVTFMEDKI